MAWSEQTNLSILLTDSSIKYANIEVGYRDDYSWIRTLALRNEISPYPEQVAHICTVHIIRIDRYWIYHARCKVFCLNLAQRSIIQAVFRQESNSNIFCASKI